VTKVVNVSNPATPQYEFGQFLLDPVEGRLLRDGVSVPLEPKVFLTLVLLVQNSGHLLTKNELMEQVWPDAVVEEGSLTRNISTLRRLLAEGSNGSQVIETLPKRGYRFLLPVRTLNTARAADPRITRRPWNLEYLIDRLKRHWRGAVFAATTALLLVGASFVYLSNRVQGDRTVIDSVAVLPFSNTTGDPYAEYISEGISDGVINSLSQFSGVNVIARNSSSRYKGEDFDLKEVASALGVKAILTGRVARHADQIQVSVQLIDARNNIQIWGEQYNRKATDLLVVQEEISRGIAERLHLQLTAAEQKKVAKPNTVNPVAYELLLKGRFYSKGSTENKKQATEYFNQAIAVDPNYALAYVELSGLYAELVNTNVLDPKEFTPKAEMAAYKALELDDNLAEAHLAVSVIKRYSWEWEAAEREIKRAIELNPNLLKAHSEYMFYLIIQGRRDEAVAAAKRARELDPLSVGRPSFVYALLLERQYDQAIEAAKKLLERDPHNPDLLTLLGFTFARNNQFQEAIPHYQEAIKLGDDSNDVQLYLGVAFARTGQSEKAAAILKRLRAGKEYVSPAGLAMLLVQLGQQELALDLLDRAYSAHDQQLVWLGIEANFDPLRADPRFKDLMRRIGLSS
jgi:TolB-like protein/DNA-binding winged helix-turn-helix (wHTH) protein/Tfp pilus assembly protein PilF